MPFISTLFEKLITESNELDYDWKCISGMQYLSEKFIKKNIKYLDIQVLVTTQSFSEKFLFELIEDLVVTLPNPEKTKETVVRILYTIQRRKLSNEFVAKYPEPREVHEKNTSRASLKETTEYSDVIERIVNYIQDEHPDHYSQIDFNALSCYRRF